MGAPDRLPLPRFLPVNTILETPWWLECSGGPPRLSERAPGCSNQVKGGLQQMAKLSSKMMVQLQLLEQVWETEHSLEAPRHTLRQGSRGGGGDGVGMPGTCSGQNLDAS